MAAPIDGEVYLEFIALGRHVRAVAVDAASGIEVSVIGPVTVSRADLGRIAVRKLERRLRSTSP